MDLFEQASFTQGKNPLADRMRPRTLDEFIGQKHILGPGKLLRRAIQADQLSSLIFYGPPGSGKTTLARIIANTTRAGFGAINAVLSGVKDIRESIEKAKEVQFQGGKYILFIDEVHRFNKSQQDALLPHVENGTIILIGATTENPYFEVNKALISRSRIFQLNSLTSVDLKKLALTAITDKRGYAHLDVQAEEQALDHLVQMSNGDARAVLNALELGIETSASDGGVVHFTLKDAEESIQQKAVLYDKDGDAHFDTISAFIKSVRGSDPDAAMYWLAKMVYAGEDPRFLFRRMIILASEDIGLADPNALTVVTSAAQAYDYVGLPEGRFHLAQACLYLATAPKSNSTLAFFDVINEVGQSEKDDVPDHLKDGTRDGEDLGHGKGYLYPHAYKDHWVAQQYLPESLQGKVFYDPSDQGYEKSIRDEVQRKRELQQSVGLLSEGFSEPAEVKSSDYWLNRTLSQTPERLEFIRKNIFESLKLKPESMVFDLTGGSGFLTWEACRTCYRGGVWSLCSTADKYQKMSDWISKFQYFTQPHLLLADQPAFNFKLLMQDGQNVEFDTIMSYGLANSILWPQIPFLKSLIQNHLSSKGNLSLCELEEYNSDQVSEILWNEVSLLGADHNVFKLLKKNHDVNQNSHKKNRSDDHFKELKSLFTTHQIEKKSFQYQKKFNAYEINRWFDPQETKSPIGDLLKGLSEPEKSRLKEFCIQTIKGKNFTFNLSYRFWKFTQ